jgi:hypothetical protein
MNDHVLDFRDYRNEFTTFAEESHHNSEQLLDKLELIRDRLLAEAEKDKLDRERRNMDGVCEWLKSPAEKTEQALHTGFQESRRKSNVSGTWILSEKEIKRWINEDTYSANDPDSGSRSPSMLWLYGKRGSGRWKCQL